MKNCPKCGQPRQGEEYKCPSCDVFYSQLDELLYEDQEKRERNTFKGALKRIRAAEDRKQALKAELATAWRNTPLKTKIVIWTVIAFVFVLVVPIF
ncbi:hypothetical protein IVG45_14965 [Methylomonas sp. LL1]|uniref:hypothetical protein n=1 Tax=Methylomonas sp. LL1 TaxID=2785785 RepID=UPI0018C3DF9D|nr:hypothetical protein [Methylomonas sp. LL1]QPK62153.1 hypothetical protein IVG45_14965 [Methylomonas sp. LL1]